MTRTLGGFDPSRALRTLVEHRVRFVLIGGWAAKLQGSPTVTAAMDICYGRDLENLERLALALGDLDVRLRGVDDEVPFVLDARSLRVGESFTLSTSAGDIDLIASPPGSGGFDALIESSDELELDDMHIAVASLPALISMKQTAARPKDLVEVEILQALQRESEHQGQLDDTRGHRRTSR